MATKKVKIRLLFVVKIVFFSSLLYLPGCFIFLPLVAVGAGEYVGARVAGGQELTGAELRQGLDFSKAYPKHVQFTLFVGHDDWTCYRGLAGYKSCFLPNEVKLVTGKKLFECRRGQGGTGSMIVTQDTSRFCVRKQQSS